MNSKDFIEELKVKYGLPSNYAAARKIGISDSRISSYMRGRREFDDEISVRIAKLLHHHPAYVMAHIQACRSPRNDIKVIWRQTAKTVFNAAKKGRAATLVGVGIIVALSVGLTESAAVLSSSDAFLPLLSIHYTHLLAGLCLALAAAAITYTAAGNSVRRITLAHGSCAHSIPL